MIEYFFDKLKSLDDLSPSPKVNDFFSELCCYSINNDLNINNSDKIDFINKNCAEAEYELEKYYSNIISSSDNPNDELVRFPYYDNYFNLTKLEYLNISYFNDDIKNILFIWWWPLPLSSIILARKYWVKSTIIDNNDEAIELSKKLISVLWLNDMISIKKSDALYYKDNFNYDVCFIASLVFLSNDIDSILKNINKINFWLVLSRTSDWTRKLLYRPIDINLYKNYFDIKSIIHPKNDIVNSFILSTKKQIWK